MIVRLFGKFCVDIDGRPLSPPLSRKGGWLLGLLALQRGEAMDRATLAGLLWPDTAHAQGLYNLRRTLGELRAVLASEAARLSPPNAPALTFDSSGAEVDVLAFDAALARGDEASLASALELYRGPLLAECDEAWIVPERRWREETYLNAIETLAAYAMARGELAAAIGHLRRVVGLDPFRETAQQALIRALVAGDDTVGALLAYRAYRLRLGAELRAQPSDEMQALFRQLRAQGRDGATGGRGDGATEQPPESRTGSPVSVAPSRPTRSRLPRPLSPFVGRETELQAVEASLEGARLVTLTGPGGVGKTRLAIQVAEAIADDYPDGVWFVDLTRLTDAALVPQAVASALGVREQPDRPLTETLAEFLRAKHLLLVLDNCEHLLAACAELGDAQLGVSPELRVLATSRQALGVSGEVVWPVAGLTVPPEGKGVGSGKDRPAVDSAGPHPPHPTPYILHLMQFEAIQLFVERARRVVSSFSLTERTADVVREICRRLDGTPLAIELATARLKALSVEEIAARLDDAFRLLTGGSRTASPRHQTLRATMDWSYDLLAEPERLLLQRLSVFTGSFSLQAAEEVAALPVPGESSRRVLTAAVDSAADGETRGQGSAVGSDRPPAPWPPAPDILDLLTQLVDQSLVHVERSDEERPASPGGTGTRYRLLETIRQYALARLRARDSESGAGEEEQLRRHHQRHYLEFAEAAGPHLWGPDHAAWHQRLEVELDNLRAALEWSLQSEPEPEVTLRLAGALGAFCIQRGHLEEARQRLAAALQRAGSRRHSPAGAGALGHLGYLAFLADDYPAARSYYEESLTARRALGDPAAVANVLCGLGYVARRQKEYAEARALHEESLEIRRTLEDRPGMAQSLIGLADTLREQSGSSPPEAGRYAEEALAIRQELGDRAGAAEALGELANIAWQQGDCARARQHREECLSLWRAVGAPLGVIHSLGALGHLARDQGELEDARAFYTESLHLRWELGYSYTLIQALEDFAELAARAGEWARMTRLFGATEALRVGMGKPLQPRERAEYERYLGGARAALGEAAVASEQAAGRTLSLGEAIAFALARESQ